MDVIDIPGYCAHLLGNLQELWENKTMCDVQVCSQNGQILTHKLVLTAASPYLANLLKDGFEGEKENCNVLKFDSVKHETLQSVLSLLYTGKLSVSKETVEDLKKFCEMIDLKYVLDAIDKYMKGNSETTTIKNSAEVGEVATEEPSVKLKVRYKQNDVKENVEEPARKRRKYMPRKETPEPLPETRKQTRARKTPVKKRKTAPKAQTKKVTKPETVAVINKDSEKVETAVEISSEVPEYQNTRKEVEVTDETNQKSNDKDDELDHEDENMEDSNCETDDVEIDSDFELSKSISNKTRSRTKTTRTIAAKRGRKSKTKDEEESEKKEKPKLPKRRQKKEFPCSQCPKILSSYKRKVFHEFSKHGTPYDTTKYSMVPCKEEVSTKNAILRLLFL